MSSEEGIIQKCIEENKKSLLILKLASHLMQVVEKGYEAMKTPWSPQGRVLELDLGPIDLFDERLVQEKITPQVNDLIQRKDDLISFTEFFPLDDKIKPVVEQVESWRQSANHVGERARQLSQAFLENRAALNTFLPLLSYPYFMVRESYLWQEADQLLQSITGDYFTLAVKNRRYQVEYKLDKQPAAPKFSAVSQPAFLAPPKAAEKPQQSDSVADTSQWTRRILGASPSRNGSVN